MEGLVSSMGRACRNPAATPPLGCELNEITFSGRDRIASRSSASRSSASRSSARRSSAGPTAPGFGNDLPGLEGQRGRKFREIPPRSEIPQRSENPNCGSASGTRTPRASSARLGRWCAVLSAFERVFQRGGGTNDKAHDGAATTATKRISFHIENGRTTI